MKDRRRCSTYSPKFTTLVFMLGMMIGSFIHLEQSKLLTSLEILAATLMFHLTHCTQNWSLFSKKQ